MIGGEKLYEIFLSSTHNVGLGIILCMTHTYILDGPLPLFLLLFNSISSPVFSSSVGN